MGKIKRKSGKFKVKYSTSVGQFTLYFSTFAKTIKHMKKFRHAEFTSDPIYFKKKNKKGKLIWYLKGYYGYSKRTRKLIRKR